MTRMKEIHAEVRAFVDEHIDAGRILALDFVALQLMARHGAIDQAYADIYRACVYDAPTRSAKEVIGRCSSWTSTRARAREAARAARIWPISDDCARVRARTFDDP